ncbi:MAG: bifunctional phosphoribosylaminoimidazolecarboxamide formyltransferase/IMP cyclohydrolase, partial [Rhizobiales bacterium]|nr:bifunctional phosphoribosylaminoimidazolecarboxamide formyltransferase/IMP cyclohydrolase [Hyphomicrobiales bacterium]
AAALAQAGLAVTDVSTVTGFPEIMDGRVKTLHPKIHGGLLGRRDHQGDLAAMQAHEIEGIDLAVVNLYPFEATIAAGADFATAIENIDIGGPALIRAAAKNHAHVAVIVEPGDYQAVAGEIAQHGGTSAQLRRMLAARAYAHTSAYDAAIAEWFAGVTSDEAPARRTFAGQLVSTLRYGENPHQQAAFYACGAAAGGIAGAEQVQGKELSYNNINDADAALRLICDLDTVRPAVAIIKHANPCGVATADSLADAYLLALRCDPVSAFGGIVATNRPLDEAAALEIAKIFTEVIIAPGADEAARAVLAAKSNLRLLLVDPMPDPDEAAVEWRSLTGGMLVQNRDIARIGDDDLKLVSKREASKPERADLLFAFRVAKHVKSNAIVYVKDGATVGIGAGQMSRVDSSRIAALKASEAASAAGLDRSLAEGSVVASDAFFPFADGLEAAIEAGATAVIQPGGSMRDEEVIAAADRAGVAMVFTGIRHFRH